MQVILRMYLNMSRTLQGKTPKPTLQQTRTPEDSFKAPLAAFKAWPLSKGTASG